MPYQQLSVDLLPTWLDLNNIKAEDVSLEIIAEKGSGLITTLDHAEPKDAASSPALITIPHDLILNSDAVKEYARENGNFRQLLDAVGHKNPRGDILLFLLVQLVLGTTSFSPWARYLQFIDKNIPVPTLWRQDERTLLRGTTLEQPLTAKMLALTREFDEFRDASSTIPYWDALLWDNRAVRLTDWFLVDALYRSRCLELPRSGTAMVPYLDMVNHSHELNAFYEQTVNADVVLKLRPGCALKKGDEVLISYGEDKSAAEMLFSYGFVDAADKSIRSMTVRLQPMPDDPLAPAKLSIFVEPPTIRIVEREGKVEWTSPFASLSVTNQEDGLTFMVAQTVNGEESLRMFWHEEDVTDRALDFERLIKSSPLAEILRLRAVTVVGEQLTERLESLSQLPAFPPEDDARRNDIRPECLRSACALRHEEIHLLEVVLEVLEGQQSALMDLPTVKTYLQEMDGGEDDAEAGPIKDESNDDGDNEFT